MELDGTDRKLIVRMKAGTMYYILLNYMHKLKKEISELTLGN